jgi:UV DNA damage endonuclease
MMRSRETKRPVLSNIRLGLCCAFREQPIKFGTTTATAIAKLSRPEGLAKLASLCLANADALAAALTYCAQAGIGCFRINSQILPLKTHPILGYEMTDLPDGAEIERRFRSSGDFVRQHKLRTCFHPDQFVVLNSCRPEVVASSLKEIEYQAEVAQWVAADVVNIHGGGAFGDKRQALADFARNLDQLSPRARALLTIENDDKVYSPVELLPLCRDAGIPLVYDVHHHRCLTDELTIEAATNQAIATWNREPLFHLSSPKDGWAKPHPERHHDFIDIGDFPTEWRELNITVEIEAKAKETAVIKLKNDLNDVKSTTSGPTSTHFSPRTGTKKKNSTI